jgi:hypothetical protein
MQSCSDCHNAFVRHVNAKSFESPPIQLTLNQAAGVSVSAAGAAAAAAVQPAKARHARYLVTLLPAASQAQTVSTIELGGQVGLPPSRPSQPTASCPPVDASLKPEPQVQQLKAKPNCCKRISGSKMQPLNEKQELLQCWHELEANMKKD